MSWAHLLVRRLSGLGGSRYLWRETEAGERQVSWRLWLLVWLLPGLFAIAAVLLAGEAAIKTLATTGTEGEVVRVYDWEDGTYTPVFRYVWSDGEATEAGTDIRYSAWNFPVGSRHDIRYWPHVKTDVILPGAHNWFVALAIGAMAVVMAVPAALVHAKLRRWQRRGQLR